MSRMPTGENIDIWDLNSCANKLINQSCTLGARYLKDPTIRLQFSREVASYTKKILLQVEDGQKDLKQGMDALLKEYEYLIRQGKYIAQKGIGIAAGAGQVALGAGICGVSLGTLCLFASAPLVLHGANNIYENSAQLWTGDPSVQGPVRQAYQAVAKALGETEREGNLAYGTVDIGMSIYGASRWVLREDAWRLFRYIETDYIRAWKVTPPAAIITERAADAITIDGMHSEWKKE